LIPQNSLIQNHVAPFQNAFLNILFITTSFILLLNQNILSWDTYYSSVWRSCANWDFKLRVLGKFFNFIFNPFWSAWINPFAGLMCAPQILPQTVEWTQERKRKAGKGC